MKTNQSSIAQLPIKHSLNLYYGVSLLIALLMFVASLAGLLYPQIVYPSDELRQAFIPNDLVNLLIGLPILLLSMWLAWRGKLVGLLFWPGALFYVFYTYVVYVFSMPLNLALLLQLALLILSAYTLIAFVTNIEGVSVKNQLAGVVSERLGGGVLLGFGILFLLRATGMMLSAIANQAPLANTEIALNITDLLIAPAFIIGGLLFWRRAALGYVTGLGLLFQASMLFIGLVVILIVRPYITTAQFAPVDVLVVTLMGMVCFVPFVLFLRGVTSKQKPLPLP
jgi:hypothetical protein